jgi:hypothetical protein
MYLRDVDDLRSKPRSRRRSAVKLRMNSPATVRSTTTATSCAATRSLRARAEEDVGVADRERS